MNIHILIKTHKREALMTFKHHNYNEEPKVTMTHHSGLDNTQIQ